MVEELCYLNVACSYRCRCVVNYCLPRVTNQRCLPINSLGCSRGCPVIQRCFFFYIITEWDRSTTTVMLLENY